MTVETSQRLHWSWSGCKIRWTVHTHDEVTSDALACSIFEQIHHKSHYSTNHRKSCGPQICRLH